MFKEHMVGSFDPSWVEQTRGSGMFAPDNRFADLTSQDSDKAHGADAHAEPADAGPNPVERAYGDGLQKGRDQAEAEFRERETIRSGLSGTIACLDAEEKNRFAERLRETVTMLCEAVLNDAAVDADLLAKRCERAIAALSDGDPPTLRMHPADIELLDDEYRLSRSIIVDPAMKRGDLRAEQGGGGVVCGPADWMVAIRSAIHGA